MKKETISLLFSLLLLVISPSHALSMSCKAFDARLFVSCSNSSCSISERVFDKSGPQACSRLPMFLPQSSQSEIDDQVLDFVEQKVQNSNNLYVVTVSSRIPPLEYDEKGHRYKDEWDKGRLANTEAEPSIERLSPSQLAKIIADLHEDSSRLSVWFSVSPVLKWVSISALVALLVTGPYLLFRNLRRYYIKQSTSRHLGRAFLFHLLSIVPAVGILFSVDSIIGIAVFVFTICFWALEMFVVGVIEVVQSQRQTHV